MIDFTEIPDRATDDDGSPQSFPCDGTSEQWLRCAALLDELPDIPGIRYGFDIPSRIRESVAALDAHGVSDCVDWVVKYVCEEIAEPLVTGWFGFTEEDWTSDQYVKIYAVRALLTAYVRGTPPPPPETVALALSANDRLALAAAVIGIP